MKKLLLFMAAVCLVVPAFAQFGTRGDTDEAFQKCASYEHEMEMRAKYEYLGDEADFEAWLADKMLDYVPTDAVTVIPIVFHVIHNGEAVGTGANLADSVIQAQLDQLNNDYRRISGTSGYNTHPDGADSEIEFTIAQINRVDRNTRGWTAPPYSRNYYESTIKPQTYADPDQYMNFWTSELSGGLLGYAQFPSQSGLGGLSNDEGPAQTDGVVCVYTSLGSTDNPNPAGGIYGAGRTATHEVGHYLGLRHIWGDGGCSVDDYVADTPTSDASNFNCPTGHVSCSSTDMIENYMDYTQDTCMNIFTNGQKARMQTVLANSLRRGFGGGTPPPPTGCSSTVASFPYGESFESGTGAWSNASGDDMDWSTNSGGTPSSNTGPTSASDGSSYLYMEASSPNYPSKRAILNGPCFDLSGETTAALSFDYHMYGAAMGSLAVEASTDDGATWSSLWSLSGDQGNSWNAASVSLDAYAGSTVWVRFNGITGSSYTSDITIDNLAVTTDGVTPPTGCSGGITSFPYSESFESGEGSWTQDAGDDIDWTRDSGGTPSSSTGPSSGSAGSWYMYVEASSPNYPSKTAIFNSPCFNLAAETSATFTFDYHMQGNAVGTASLQASTGGSSWSTEWTQSGTQGSAWNSASVNLDAYAGGDLQLRFVGTTASSWQGDIAIDNLNLSTDGGGGTPTTTVTVTINSDNYGSETTWEIRDSGNNVVASGGPYANNITDVTNVNLASGSYTFTINDSYGDGICCAYGNGSYTVTAGGSTLASGGAFTTSESTNFSL